MELKGAEELQAIINKWEILSKNIEKEQFPLPIILPHLFIYTQPGYGNTKLLALLSNYLESKKNLMKFYGDTKFFEFKLEYCAPEQNFVEMYRFIESLRGAAGFRNEFKGIIRINIDEWIGHQNEKHFLDFLHYLQKNSSSWLIALTISNHEENFETMEMEGLVGMYLRFEKITLHMPSDEDLAGYAAQLLGRYGLILTADARKILTDSINVLMDNEFFYGRHTVFDLCNHIIYTLYCEPKTVQTVITAEMLKDFTADSYYIKRTSINSARNSTLGFR